MTTSDKPVVLPRGGVWGAALAMTVICAAQFVLELNFRLTDPFGAGAARYGKRGSICQGTVDVASMRIWPGILFL
jgi:hypothetical protein